MIQIKFKDLEPSEAARKIAHGRISDALKRFPKGKPRAVSVTLGMQNSPAKPGADVFTVRTEVFGGRYHGLILEKSSGDLYAAIADVSDRLLERFNRHSDRLRVKALKQRREFALNRRRERQLRAEGE